MRVAQALAGLQRRLQPRLRAHATPACAGTASWASARSRCPHGRGRRRGDSLRRVGRGPDGAALRPQGRDRGRGVRSVLGLDMPVFPKRRFQHGAATPESRGAPVRGQRGDLPGPLPRPLRGLTPGPRGGAARIRALRPPKEPVDPWRPLGSLVEDERRPGGGQEHAVTVFLAGSECPFTCVFCDLWRHTLDGPTPPGALPAQLRTPWPTRRCDGRDPSRIKLYNASNFFDDARRPGRGPSGPGRALLRPFAGSPSSATPGSSVSRCFEFADRLEGRLEVAMGLETVHPDALARLNKRLTLDDFARAAVRLRARPIDLRAFVLLGAPFVPPAEARVGRALGSSRRRRGASVVSLIPVRGGNGELERLRDVGRLPRRPPSASSRRRSTAPCGCGGAVVIADLWDADRLPGCAACRPRASSGSRG